MNKWGAERMGRRGAWLIPADACKLNEYILHIFSVSFLKYRPLLHPTIVKILGDPEQYKLLITSRWHAVSLIAVAACKLLDKLSMIY